ncbi:MAG: GGDEF domain-containing protein, partial [Kangiellaceae bacterium]|nr:GGDEF domain-containing protein [Kangiellaceae bacterium]
MRSLQAATFSIGAPLGWLLIRYLEGADISQDIQSNVLLYAYLLFGTLIVFILFGAYVGNKEKYITELAVKDPLTQIHNRRFFIGRLTEEISRASRYQKPLSMIYFDLDHFKVVNDTYGHPVGDKVLVKVAREVKKNIRSHDIFARTGGEEFAILLPQCEIANAVANAERIRLGLEKMAIEVGEWSL